MPIGFSSFINLYHSYLLLFIWLSVITICPPLRGYIPPLFLKHCSELLFFWGWVSFHSIFLSSDVWRQNCQFGLFRIGMLRKKQKRRANARENFVLFINSLICCVFLPPVPLQLKRLIY